MIIKLTFDWQPHREGDGVFQIAEVGKKLTDSWPRKEKSESIITSIKEHPAMGEGDKWYYDICFKDGTSQRTFYPHGVSYDGAKTDDLPF